MTGRGLALLVPLWFALALPGAAEEARRNLPDMVRTLTMLQDAAARGDADAASLQQRMTVEISALMAASDPLALPDPASLRAAIIYVLSGGRPDDAGLFVRLTPPSDPLHWLLRGAMHYAKGERGAALKVLQPFDPAKLPASIGGRVALATATLLPEEAAADRITMLELATRLMPGTLVEEAALRRIAAIAGEQGNALQFQKTAARYVWRYGSSLYAAGFMTDYAHRLVAFEAAGKPVPRGDVEALMNKLAQPVRCTAYLSVARLAGLKGFADLALFAASRARRIAAPGSAEWHAATLYDAAILVTGADYDIARSLLDEVDAAKLDAQSKDLFAAVKKMADRLRAAAVAPSLRDLADTKDPPQPTPEQLALARQADQAMAAAARLLQGMAP